MNEQSSCVEMIRTLVAFPTISRDSNLNLIDFVREYLRPYDADFRLTYDDDRRKANLFVSLGPAIEGGMVLSGHTDVVPVQGQVWDSDPFQLVERDGCLFGRGTSDMKSFIAVALHEIPQFVERGLKAPLHLALSYDEEVGCIGVGRLLSDLKSTGLKPAGCIVGEPTLMKPVIAHKGKRSYRARVTGLAAHSAYAPHGVNALEAAAEVVAYLKRMARRHRDEGPYDRGFDVSYTTIHTGVLHSGVALNIVPHECSFDFEFRYLPQDDPDQLIKELNDYIVNILEPEMRAVYKEAGFDIQLLSQIPALDNRSHTPIVALAQTHSGESGTGKVSYGTEGSQFQSAGIPTVVCGPGSIQQAHRPNEFISLDQINHSQRFLQSLMVSLCER
jgi:acetylornithine deacetylase